MSKYTMEVRTICEVESGLREGAGFNDIDNVIRSAIPRVFNFDFPIFDEAYREVLEFKILQHYYTREIGSETVGLWKLRLATVLRELMPYYNKLYESELLKFNPLYDVDVTRKKDGSVTDSKNENGSRATNGSSAGSVKSDVDSTLKSNENTSDDSWDSYSDTPQGTLNNVKDLSYLTNARNVVDSEETSRNDVSNSKSDTTSSNNITNNEVNSKETNGNTVEDYLEKVSGKQGSQSYSALLMEYRNTFINIDVMILNELEDLFFQLW